jgi:hypothetical protein
MATGPQSRLLITNPNLGTVRNHIEVIESGIDRHNPSEQAESALKTILKIEGDAMGTLNAQEVFNKTQDGGTFS